MYYYNSGNYEGFSKPKKTDGIEKKSAYIIGSGIAALASAVFLIRDGYMPGDKRGGPGSSDSYF